MKNVIKILQPTETLPPVDNVKSELVPAKFDWAESAVNSENMEKITAEVYKYVLPVRNIDITRILFESFEPIIRRLIWSLCNCTIKSDYSFLNNRYSVLKAPAKCDDAKDGEIHDTGPVDEATSDQGACSTGDGGDKDRKTKRVTFKIDYDEDRSRDRPIIIIRCYR